MHRVDCLSPGFVQEAVPENKHLNPAINQLYLACQRQNQQVEVLESMVVPLLQKSLQQAAQFQECSLERFYLFFPSDNRLKKLAKFDLTNSLLLRAVANDVMIDKTS